MSEIEEYINRSKFDAIKELVLVRIALRLAVVQLEYWKIDNPQWGPTNEEALECIRDAAEKVKEIQ